MYRKGDFLYNDEQDTIIECLDKMIETFSVPKDIENIKRDAFKDCYLLKTLIIDGNEDLFIETNAFPEPSIKNLVIGNYNAIQSFAINVKNLTKITFLTTAREIDSLLFYSDRENIAPNLEEIEIIEGNTHINDKYQSDYTKDGIWYQTIAETEKLILYPPGKKDEIVKVEDFVTDIDEGCFSYNPYVKAIILPEICKNPNQVTPFIDCKNLESIAILNKNTAPFISWYGCPSFCRVYTDIEKVLEGENVTNIPLKNFATDYFTSMKEINNFYKDFSI